MEITPAFSEPMPGWVDNLNGPTGVMVGGGKGVIRSMLCNGELKSEVIPVDIAVNGLIALPHHFHIQQKKPDKIPVFNLTCAAHKRRTWRWIMEKGKQFAEEYPFEVGLWYPDGNMTTNKFYHWLCVLFFMWLPAYLIDFLLLIARQKRFMIRVQTKIAVGLEVLQFFTTRSWDFKADNFNRVMNQLTAEENKLFNMNTEDVDDVEYMRTCILGARQYCLQEPMSSLPRARTQMKFMYALDRFCKATILTGFAYWISLKVGIIG